MEWPRASDPVHEWQPTRRHRKKKREDSGIQERPRSRSREHHSVPVPAPISVEQHGDTWHDLSDEFPNEGGASRRSRSPVRPPRGEPDMGFTPTARWREPRFTLHLKMNLPFTGRNTQLPWKSPSTCQRQELEASELLRHWKDS